MNKKENDCFVKSSTPCVAPLVWEENCLFCGEKCDLQNDKKHPDGRYEDCRNKLLICEILGLPVPKRYMQFMKTNPTFFCQICLQVTHLMCGHHLIYMMSMFI